MTHAMRSLAMALVLLAGTAHADRLFDGGPQVMQIEGTVAADEDAAGKIGFDAVSFGLDGGKTMRWVGVVTARTRDGDAFMGQNIIQRLDPYKPMLLVSGPQTIVGVLRDMPVGERIMVEGMLEPETRNYLLSNVKILPQPEKKPEPEKKK
jgi:hypothetical protein